MTATHDRTPAPHPPLQEVVDELRRSFSLAEIYVFGSRAREVAARVRGQPVPPGEALPGSDVDLGVRPLPGTFLDVDAVVELTGELEEALEAPRVDVVVLPGASAFLALDDAYLM